MPSSRTSTPHSQSSGARTPRRTGAVQGPVRRNSQNVVVLAVFLVVVVLIAGVVFLTTRGGDGSGPPAAGDAGMAHVHGLGVDPRDGVLYAGTHYGLFEVPETGEAALVADRVQDFMGFTVVGPGHYLASGHPGEGQGGPSSLGLIESTDGGQTWQSLSLAGEADFHSLEARHGLVYGLDSVTGEFMVSRNKQAWDTRSQIPMADFAVSPYDPNMLLATTEQGLARSEDGGRDFQPVPSAPVLQLVTWAGDGTVFGVEPDGTVHASTDDGKSWQRRGGLDAAPEALTATDTADVYAAADGAILVSVDGGRTFTVRYSG